MTQIQSRRHPHAGAALSVPPLPAQVICPEPTAQVFGTLLLEVTLPGNTLPALPGWTLRLWPQARLGDATLEARRHDDRPDTDRQISELVTGLRSQGIGVLGPVRHRR